MTFLFVGGPRDGERCTFIKDFLEVPFYDGPVEIGRSIAENLSFKLHYYYREVIRVCDVPIYFYRSQDLDIVDAITQVFENYHAKKT